LISKSLKHHRLVIESNALEGISAVKGLYYEAHMRAACQVEVSPHYYLSKPLELHKLFRGVLEIGVVAGQYRSSEAFVTNQPLPSPTAVPILMEEWLAQVSRSLDVCKSGSADALQSAHIVHYEFLCIHPFGDGNGRCARLLMNAFLGALDLPWYIVDQDGKSEYLSTLRRYENRDFRPKHLQHYAA